MKIADFLSKLKGVSGNGEQFNAMCPAHDDRRASLSISRGTDGRILVMCHAGCSPDAITNAMGFTLHDLFNHPNKPEAEYRYVDQNGTFLAKKTRWPGKRFSWSRPDGMGGWIMDRKDVPNTLYNLPVVQGAACVFVVEGEKDVDTLSAYGLKAVSGADGAGPGKWRTEYTQQLKEKNIVIIPDNDEVGRKFAIETANALYGVAASVRLIDLTLIWPEILEHGDITDLYDQMGGIGLEEVQELVRTTPEYIPLIKENLEPVPEFFDEKGRFQHNVMGDFLIRQHNVCKISNVPHVYEDGVYLAGENIIHGIMLGYIPSLQDAKRREVYKYLCMSRKVPKKEISSPDLIPFKSRIFDLKNDRFLNYTPEYVFLSRFPNDYYPDAVPQRIVTETIDTIADHNKEVIDLLYEAMGSCFYRINKYRGAVMLYGQSGNNGKSTLLNMITQLVGEENTSHLSLQDTNERFRLVEVYGKAANIGDDIPTTLLPDSSIFKKLVTGEIVTAEKKGQDVFTFKPFCKLFFAMNGLPQVGDISKAFFSRILLIPLNHNFSADGTQNVSLKDRQWTQDDMNYLTCQAMDGLKRLIRNGSFTRSQAVNDTLTVFERENNPIMEFLEDYGSVEGMPTAQVYSNYRTWSFDEGHRNPISRRRFTNAVINRTGFQVANKRHPFYNNLPGKCYVTK